jgi:hypothetical protein
VGGSDHALTTPAPDAEQPKAAFSGTFADIIESLLADASGSGAARALGLDPEASQRDRDTLDLIHDTRRELFAAPLDDLDAWAQAWSTLRRRWRTVEDARQAQDEDGGAR